MSNINLFSHQIAAIKKLENGKILVGGVGSGKSRTSLAYYYFNVCNGQLPVNGEGTSSPMSTPYDLYIFTTAQKRDKREWEAECFPFGITREKEANPCGVRLVVDSWNNITKYTGVKNAFFIFDEQRVIGSGVWVKSFLKLAQNNKWILLSATPGDTWSDYIPVFIANGFYKNRTEFIRRHIVYSNFTKFPKIDHYVEVQRLVRLRDSVIVNMHYSRKTIAHDFDIPVPFDKDLFSQASVTRWHPYEKRPIKDIGELCYVLRRIVNSDYRRIDITGQLTEKHDKLIIFYNFNYERDLLLELGKTLCIPTAEWSGHRHEPIPETDRWIYIVQYAAGAEGWNCIETNAMIFYSANYSYKATVQAAGRIDRLNTTFTDLYYYYLRSNSSIDIAIQRAFNNKKDFNEKRFAAA